MAPGDLQESNYRAHVEMLLENREAAQGEPYTFRMVRPNLEARHRAHARVGVRIRPFNHPHKTTLENARLCRLHQLINALGIESNETRSDTISRQAALGDPTPQGSSADVSAGRGISQGLIRLPGHDRLLFEMRDPGRARAIP